jgi:TPR repeat protein
MKEAARKGSGEAQYGMGNIYFSGNGASQDYAKAYEWYLTAVASYEQCDEQCGARASYFPRALCPSWCSDVFYKLGVIKANGLGTSQDYNNAFEYISKAANQGHRDAEVLLAEMFAKGQGVSQNSAMAFYWYKQAAELGDATAMYKYGVMFFEGEGTPVDQSSSYVWLQDAAKAGNKDAEKFLNEHSDVFQKFY